MTINNTPMQLRNAGATRTSFNPKMVPPNNSMHTNNCIPASNKLFINVFWGLQQMKMRQCTNPIPNSEHASVKQSEIIPAMAAWSHTNARDTGSLRYERRFGLAVEIIVV
eukprot:TRINITY_DN56445_c1_g2_i1.p2 TRINITY_DN56445_c1_g2~~TRINITY_DN56445_c1_g2_i1.p2  ORF type:complete len:110 (+),score=11.66 TRINITY_DN56445_c1_g2_i1:295-624(+)